LESEAGNENSYHNFIRFSLIEEAIEADGGMEETTLPNSTSKSANIDSFLQSRADAVIATVAAAFGKSPHALTIPNLDDSISSTRTSLHNESGPNQNISDFMIESDGITPLSEETFPVTRKSRYRWVQLEM